MRLILTMSPDAYDRLIALIDEAGAPDRLIDHPPEGRTEIVSAMRGNPVRAAAKCMVVMLKRGKRETRFVLAVVPGDRRVDLGALAVLREATYVSFASASMAERLAGSDIGTILPFSFTAELELIAHPAVLDERELFFNAGRLDRSMVRASRDYARIATPRLESTVEGPPEAESYGGQR
jgi:Ala-tRNA(Pro) deacylase